VLDESWGAKLEKAVKQNTIFLLAYDIRPVGRICSD